MGISHIDTTFSFKNLTSREAFSLIEASNMFYFKRAEIIHTSKTRGNVSLHILNIGKIIEYDVEWSILNEIRNVWRSGNLSNAKDLVWTHLIY